jgi:regulator of protease activity HflC (stomatin/prohibitin superfamily)
MREMAVTVLSSQVGSMVRDDVLMSREVLRRQIHARLMEITEPWGVEVRDVDIPYMGRA